MNDVQSKVVPENKVVVPISEEWHIARALRTAKSVAHAAGLTEVAVYSVATSVSELANNIFFHSRSGGAITINVLKQTGRSGVEIIAEDTGRGIADIDLAMQDGHTTNGGLGGGLPGVERLMDEFEINSTVDVGTRIVARKWRQ